MEVCRVCLASTPDKNINQLKTSKKDGHKGCSEILLFCLDIQITEHSQITKKICTKCFKKILAFYKFKSMALKNDAYLKSSFPEECPKFKLEFKPIQDVQCLVEPKSDAEIDVLKDAVKSELEFEENDLKKEPELEMSVHFVKNETFYDSDDEILSDMKKVGTTKVICNPLQTFEANSDIGNSKKCKTPLVYASKVKPKYAIDKKNKTKLEKQIKKKQTNNPSKRGREVCGECGKNVINLKVHSIVHIPKEIRERFPCQQCDKVFLTSAALSVHHNIKHLGILGHCNICNKDYACLSTHQLIMHKKDKLKVQCEVCKVRFLCQSMLDIHMTVHTKEKPYQCDHCGKNFRTKIMVTTHIRSVHELVKNFVCQHCSRAFFQKSHLISHMRTHTNEKPFKCIVCDKSFPSKRNLRNHQYSHRTAKEFHCKICSMSFRRPGYLQAHMLTHSSEKKFLCKYCGVGFKRKDPCKKHEYKKHLKNMVHT